ncbi:MAG: UDP-N-acetylmuramoyl-tripeptide--D-alanyl-D-alanine ligase, partial [Phycisphaerales bacterium]|nr:UDP-N-acetylmuramoyl-tripeptide--D-alanyl-D-alanine ligase [Phycisphaerales bacterium]
MKVLGGQWLMPPSADRAYATLTGVSTDSRNVASGQIFIALKGEKFDGHDFVAP